MTKSKSLSDSIKIMAMISVLTALTCILAPNSFAIPVSPVPISLTSIAIFLAVYVLGTKYGTVSYLIYLLLGLAGLPIFSGYTGGPAKLAGPTGGYLIGFIFMAIIAGIFIDKFPLKTSIVKQPKRIALHMTGMILGTLVCYLFGTVWLAVQLHLGFQAALMIGVVPYIPGDLAKMIFSLILGSEIRSALTKAGLH